MGGEQRAQAGLAGLDGVHGGLGEAGPLQVKHLGAEEHLGGQPLHGGQLHLGAVWQTVAVALVGAVRQALIEVQLVPQVLWHIALMHLGAGHGVQLEQVVAIVIFLEEALKEIDREVLARELQRLRPGPQWAAQVEGLHAGQATA